MPPNGSSIALGDLYVTGGTITFRPSMPLEFNVPSQSPLAFQLRFRYREASALKEEWRLSFTVQVPGVGAKTQDFRLKDRPIIIDEEWGAVSVAAPPMAPGLHAGSFRVEGSYDERSWLGRLRSRRRFHEDGTFTFRAR